MASTRTRRMTIAAVVLASVVSGCNAIFGITSGQPGAVCLPSRPDTCAAATLTDPDNCCAPGRTCRGGACTGGACGAVTVTTHLSHEVVAVLVTGDSVVWSSGVDQDLYVGATTADAGAPRAFSTKVGTAFQNISGIATDGEHVYFSDVGTSNVGRIPLAGGAAEVFVTGDPADPVSKRVPRLAVAGGYVYWAAPATGIYRAPVAGTLPAKAEKVADAPSAYGVAVDDAHVYWSDNGTSSIRRMAFTDVGTGAASEMVAAGVASGVSFLAVDADSVLWSTDSDLYLAPKQAGSQSYSPLASETDSSVNELWTDGRDVFWTTTAYLTGQKGGRLRRISKQGGPIVTIAQNDDPNGFGGVAGDCDTVFWLDGKSIGLMRATK